MAGREHDGERRPGREAWLFTVDGEAYALLEVGRGTRPLPATLTAAEREVAALAGEGLTNAAIAAQRGCGPPTVAKQLSAIYRKLGLEGRAALQAWLAGGPGAP